MKRELSKVAPDVAANIATHTPGPWHVDMDPIDTATDIRAKYGWNGCETIPNQLLAQMCGKRTNERDANARLIAAAPELLSACKWALPLVLRWFNEKPHCQDHSGLTAIREAIAKAEGREL